ncbi:MAG TPA: hypothetical protein VI454_14340 [Verrucomicrobiae bacterium]|jgi:hypothetical protein
MNWFAAGDSWIGLLVFLAFILSSALQTFLKRRKGGTDGEGGTIERPQPLGAKPEPATSTKTLSWEEEIRRLLEGEAPQAPPAPPPVVIVERRPPAPPPIPIPQRVERVPVRREPVLPPPPPIFSRTGQTEASETHEVHKGSGHLARLEQSAVAHARASQLEQHVAQRLRQVDAITELARPTPAFRATRHVSPEVTRVLELLRQPRSARQVFIAQAVLGSPKALEG